MIQLFQKYGITINEKQEQKFKKLLELFLDWNSKINLSAIREPDEIIKKHFIDSLLITKHFEMNEKNILDLGAGGGFPSLPLAIMTNSKVTALDSVGKKMKAVQSMADVLGLTINTIHGRAEDFAKDPKYREQFDMVISRAVASWPTLLELTLPFVKKEGSFIAYQGPAIREELNNFIGLEKAFGGDFEVLAEDKIDDEERLFVEIFKEKKCSKEFPRKAGEAKRNPVSL